MARHRRRVQPADLPGFSQTPLTRRTVIAGAGAAIAAVGTRRAVRSTKHSMVRGHYTLNAAGGVPLFDPS
jgi:hypothetical protein